MISRLKTEARVVSVSDVLLRAVYRDPYDVLTEMTVYGDFREEFKIGDLISYSEEIIMKRVNDDQQVGPKD